VEAVRGAGRPVDDGAGEEVIGGGVVHPAVQLAGVLHTDYTHTTRGQLYFRKYLPPRAENIGQCHGKYENGTSQKEKM
jgi:hypothetical protein